MNPHDSLSLCLRVLALSLPLLDTSWAQTTSNWSGSATSSLNTGGNWTPSGTPTASDSVTNTMQWNGTTSGALNLTYNFAIGNGGTQNNGLNINLTSAQTGSVTINSVTPINADQTFRIRNITLAAGAGAFTLGNNTGANKVNVYMGGVGTFTTPSYTNNSSNTATLGSNVQVLGTGGNERRTWTLGGSGDWDVAAPISNSTFYNLDVNSQKMGTLTLTKSGAGTVTIQNAVNTYAGAVTIDGGTLQAASNTALGWGASMLSTSNSALNVVTGTTVNSAGTLDLINEVTVNEQISLINGGKLMNSQAGSTSVLDNGLAGVVLLNRGSGYTNSPASTSTSLTVSGGGGTGATVVAYIGNAAAPNPQGVPNSVGGTGSNTQFNSLTLSSAGSGYTSAPTLTVGGGGTGFTYQTVLSNLTLTGTTNQIGGAGNLQVNAVVSGSGGGFQKIGAGSAEFTAINTYTGSTLVSEGTLLVSGTGSINTSSGVTVDGGTLRYNSSTNLTSPLTFTSGTLSGTNFSGNSLSIGANQILAPGNSTGTLSVGATAWTTGGTLQFEINDALGAAGSSTAGWDLIAPTTLDLTAGVGQFTVQIVSLDNMQAFGLAQNFIETNNYQWLLVDAGSAITGFNSNQFLLNSSAFQNPNSGIFSISQGTGADTDKMYLNYAVPEPSAALLFSGSYLVLAFRRRRAQSDV